MSGPDYRVEAGLSLVLDDRLWMQAIGVERHFFEVRQHQAPTWTHDETILAKWIHMGTSNLRPEHRQSNTALRSMRYSAIMVDRLWSMIALERERVRLDCLPCLGFN